MKCDTITMLWIALACGACMFCFGGGCGDILARKTEHAQAIEAGCAEWRIDAKTGERTLYWLSGGTNAIPYKHP